MTHSDWPTGTSGAGGGGLDSGPDPGSAREEAERLVATGLAALSMAADRIGAPARERGGAAAAGYDALGDVLFGRLRDRRHSVANDSAACCQCPVCKLISAAREPDPVMAERLATGAGTLAEGAARVLRTVAGPADPPDAPGREASEPSAAAAPPDPWAAVTAAGAAAAGVRADDASGGPDDASVRPDDASATA